METPPQIIFQLMMNTVTTTAIRVAIEAKIFDAARGKFEIGVEELASAVRADPVLISRIMRVLTASGIFDELAEGQYGSTAVSDSMIDASPLRDAFCLIYDNHDPALVKLPQFLRRTGFRNPEDPMHSPYQDGFQTNLHRFEHIQQDPELSRVFDSAMAAQRVGRGEHGQDWFNFYPVEASLWNESRPTQDEVLLVDIGGGEGHDLLAFKARYPNHPGRLVLEDLPKIISQISGTHHGIEVIGHDFFTAQPIKSARAYYFRTVLHDWPDNYCHKILKNVIDAMGPYSKILLNEIVLAEKGTPLFPAQMDIAMMATFSSMERTKKQWETLLNGAGLKIQNVFAPAGAPLGAESLIEVIRK